jgi:hypothetical protein
LRPFFEASSALEQAESKFGPRAAETQIPPHSHPDERSCFVLSGMWYFGYGTERDETKLQLLPAGSRYTEPAGRMHFAGTKDVEAIAECTAMGPTGTTFANPVDDPRNASK